MVTAVNLSVIIISTYNAGLTVDRFAVNFMTTIDGSWPPPINGNTLIFFEDQR
jgi:hypothetical protein